MGTFFRAAKQQDIPEGTGVLSQIEGRSIAIFHLPDGFYAIGHHCPHRGGPLAEGEVQGSVVTCPWHGWTFDVTTGLHPDNERVKVPVFPVELREDEVWVEI